MKRIHVKQAIGQTIEGLICPKIMKKLKDMKIEACKYTATYSGYPLVRVHGPDGQYTVDMEKRRCACRRWQLIGIACVHGLACIF